MYIETIHVENVGPFKKLDAQFNPGMNVIIGGNGVGKTSLLRCITNCMTQNSMENMRLRKDAQLKLNCVLGDKKITCGADQLVNKDQEYRHFEANDWKVTPEEGYLPEVIFNEKEYNLLAIGAYRNILYSKIEGMKRERLGAERRNSYLKGNPGYLESMAVPSIKQWMINRYYQIEKEWAVIEKFNWENIISNLQVIAPRESKFKFVRIGRDLEPVFSINDSECYLEELSSGFKSILSIVFLIVDWIEGINEGDAAMINNAVGTVLIDEIDAHLHPSWQATILNSLRTLFPHLQFIVTTHSPNVIMSAKKKEVMIFNNENGVVNLQADGRSFGAWQVSDVLSDIMQAPGLDYIDISGALSDINRAYEDGDIGTYKDVLGYLKTVLNPNDPILKVYHIRLGELQLRHD